MSLALTGSQLAAAEREILGPDGELLLRYMRSVFFHRGVDRGLDTEAGHIGALAERLEWTHRDPSGCLRLTPVGWRIADSAREYCYWLDDGRTLPCGLTPKQVAGTNVLDVGCGFGRYLLALQRHGAMAIGVDVCEAYLQLSGILARREGLSMPPVVCGTGERLPFGDEVFHWVLSIASLGLMDIATVLSEVSRVLVDGGRLVLVTGTLLSPLKQAARGLSQAGRVRADVRELLNLANSCSVQFLGSRLFPRRGPGQAYWPVHVTVGHLRRLMGRVGLKLSLSDVDREVFVATREPRRFGA